LSADPSGPLICVKISFHGEYKKMPMVDQHEIVVCPSGTKVHFMNRQTGKLLGHKE